MNLYALQPLLFLLLYIAALAVQLNDRIPQRLRGNDTELLVMDCYILTKIMKIYLILTKAMRIRIDLVIEFNKL